jgi:enoyl-CoA hydratase
MPEPTTAVRVALDGRVGRLTLDQPRSINALTLAMVDALSGALLQWRDHDAVDVVVLDGAGDRGLCAGGDIRFLRECAIRGDVAKAAEFWRREYALDTLVADYPVPVVALMDGIVMGGGVGLAGHARHRLVTETSRVAMPEVSIGYTPDVGTAYLVTRTQDPSGRAALLTGVHLGAADAVRAGLADAFLPRERFGGLLRALREVPATEAVDAATERAPEPASGSVLDPAALEGMATAPDPAGAWDALFAVPTARALQAAASRASPLSWWITFEALRHAEVLTSRREGFAQDLRLSLAFTGHPDFAEGIRAVLEKDRAPHWRADTIAEVAPADLRPFLAALAPEVGTISPTPA